ncbi:ARC6/PARC6 family protein [Lyngbya sp. CCY1209]|uniref:ARC6/PARC6 family protein n=1 Tax=Lyngbya sp. CCY1209 TaxID=2886103 RepID=UPI002D21343E|nr:ARC6/PARC6 family protein [Lyngbya sp. CCY1209]MEB3886961.1 ARC6/PARC6 family protein [Lyngbya sp. CCY1209]
MNDRPMEPAKSLAVILLVGMVATPVSASPEIAVNLHQTPNAIAQNNASLSLGRAADLIDDWLRAKSRIFAPPFDRDTLAALTTSRLYADTLEAIDYLLENDGYYEYGVQKLESVERFAESGDRATIEVTITEDVTFYQGGKVIESTFNTQQVRYQLRFRDNLWKIADSQILE